MSVSIAGSQDFSRVNSGTYSIVGTGNLLLVFYYETTAGVTNLTITDTNNNTWHQVVQVFNFVVRNNSASLWWCLTNGAGSDTITCDDNFGSHTPFEPGFMVIEYNNSLGWLANPQDTFATARGLDFAATDSVTHPTLNTTLNDIVISCIVDVNGAKTLTAGTGYVMRVTDDPQYAGLQDQIGAGGLGRPPDAYTPGAVALRVSDQDWISIMVGFNLPIPPPIVLKTNILRWGHGSRMTPPYNP